MAVKLDPRGYVGIPDRLVIGPRLVAFVELKRPRGGVVSKKQQRWHDRIAAWGLPVVVLSTVEEVDEWVNTSFG